MIDRVLLTTGASVAYDAVFCLVTLDNVKHNTLFLLTAADLLYPDDSRDVYFFSFFVQARVQELTCFLNAVTCS